jgi:hypothetical protein
MITERRRILKMDRMSTFSSRRRMTLKYVDVSTIASQCTQDENSQASFSRTSLKGIKKLKRNFDAPTPLRNLSNIPSTTPIVAKEVSKFTPLGVKRSYNEISNSYFDESTGIEKETCLKRSKYEESCP